MKLKKIFIVLLSVLLCSCQVQEKKKTKITFWHVMNGEEEEILKSLVKDFEKENPNIKVNLQNQSDYKSLNSKLMAAQADKDSLPNITLSYADWMIDPIEDGIVLNIDKYANSKKINDIYDVYKKEVSVNNHIYGLPFAKSTEVIFYNKDILDKLNLNVPTSYEEFKNVSAEIYATKKIAGGGFDSLNNYYEMALKNMYNIEISPKLNPTSNESINVVNYLKEGIDNKYFRLAGVDKWLSTTFANEKVAMFISSSASLSWVRQGCKNKFKYAIAPYPAKYRKVQGTNMYAFKKNDDENKASVKLMEYLVSEKAQLKWANHTGYLPVNKKVEKNKQYQNEFSNLNLMDNLYTTPIKKGNNKIYLESEKYIEKICVENKNKMIPILNEFKQNIEK